MPTNFLSTLKDLITGSNSTNKQDNSTQIRLIPRRQGDSLPDGNYDSSSKIVTKKIMPFSLCPPARNYLQKKVDNLKTEQVEESAPSITAGIRK